MSMEGGMPTMQQVKKVEKVVPKKDESRQFERVENSFNTKEATRLIPAVMGAVHNTDPITRQKFIASINDDILSEAIELAKRRTSDREELVLLNDFEQEFLGH